MSTSKLTGSELYELIGKPQKIVAPMVDQSELGWRILSRKYGAQLCYTPMFHAKLFATNKKYRKEMFCEFEGLPESDRPLIVQFCANDPVYLLQAAKFVEDKCDAVDLNLGCPQGIAKKGKYGAFLMDDWELISKLIKNLHENLKIPVTAKMRVYPSNSQNASTGSGQKVSNGANDEDFDREKTLKYARMILNSGAQILTVHGRTRDMKGQLTGIANWNILKFLYESLKTELKEQNKKLVFFANGNVLYPEDIERCLKFIGCHGVMSAEANLYNPGIFYTDTEGLSTKEIYDKQHPRVDKIIREYFEIVKSIHSKSTASQHAIKAHFFKLLQPFLSHHTDIRQLIATTSIKNFSIDEWEKIVEMIESRVEEVFDESKDSLIKGDLEWWGGSYKTIPYWRCQPYFRKVDGKLVVEDVSNKQLTEIDRKRKIEDNGESIVKKQQVETVVA